MRKYIDIINGVAAQPERKSFLTLLEAKAFKDMMAPLVNYLSGLELAIENGTATGIGVHGEPYGETELVYVRDARVNANNIIDRAKEIARSDRQTWFTRLARLALIRALAPKLNDPTLNAMELKWRKDYERITGAGVDDVDNFDFMRANADLNMVFSKINLLGVYVKHIGDSQYEPIRNYVFNNQTNAQVRDDISVLEKEFQEKQVRMIPLEEGDQIIVTMPNGWVWVMKDRGGCSAEAKAMGHCGNGQGSAGQRLLSFRHYAGKNHQGVDVYEPYATFILHADGFLGEMKGRFNEKPGARDRDEIKPIIMQGIKELLKLDLIKGLRGGGYLAQNNFAMSDLPQDERFDLFASHPKLMKLTDRYDMYGMDDEMMKIIRDGVMAQGQGWWSPSNLVKADILPEDFEKLTDTYPEVMSVEELYRKNGMTDHLMDVIWEGVRENGPAWYSTHGLRLKPLHPMHAEVSIEDSNKLFEKYPLLMHPIDYIDTVGFDDKLCNWIYANVLKFGTVWYNRVGLDLNNNLSREQRNHLFDLHPELMTPLQHFEKRGLDDAMLEKIRVGYATEGPRYWHLVGFGPHKMTPEQRAKLFDEIPFTMEPKDYYEHRGLTPEFIEYMTTIRTGDPKIPHDMTKWTLVAPYNAWDHMRKLIDIMSDEDRERMFKIDPEMMTRKEYYDRFGLDEDLEDEIVNGVNDDGRQWWGRKDTMTVDDLSNEDRNRLFADNHDLAPFTYRLQKWGITDELRTAILNEYNGYYESDKGDWEHVGHDPDEPKFPIADFENWVFIARKWKDVDDYIREMGNDEFQHYHDDADRYHDYDIHSSDCERIFDSLPQQAQDALRTIAWKAKLDNEYGVDPDDTEAVAEWEEENEENETDLSDSEIVSLLEDHDDENYSALVSGAHDAYTVGSEDEMYKEKVRALTDIDLDHDATIVFKQWKNEKGKENIEWDGPVKVIVSPADICAALDEIPADEEVNFFTLFNKDEKKLDFREPQYGFQDFDEEAGVERFFEEWTVDEDTLEKCPYHVPSMSDAEKMEAIKVMRGKLGRSYYHNEEIESQKWDSEKISDVLSWYLKNYYIVVPVK